MNRMTLAAATGLLLLGCSANDEGSAQDGDRPRGS